MRATHVAEIPPEIANQLLLLAWTRGGGPEMAALLAPYAGDRAYALCTEWMPRRMQADDAPPGALPGGQIVPPASTPWPRAASPLSGVDLPVAAVVELAVTAQMDAFLEGDYTDAGNALVRLVLPERLEWNELLARLARWVDSGQALACVQAARPTGAPIGWLGIAEANAAQRALLLARTDAREANDVERLSHAMRPLVAAGLTPAQALGGSVDHLANGILPSGQWVDLPDDGAPRAASAPPAPDSARARVLAAAGSLLLDQPLHWALLATTRWVEDATVETMAVALTKTATPVIFFAPRFVAELTRPQLLGALVHEVDHVLLGHPLITIFNGPSGSRTKARRKSPSFSFINFMM